MARASCRASASGTTQGAEAKFVYPIMLVLREVVMLMIGWVLFSISDGFRLRLQLAFGLLLGFFGGLIVGTFIMPKLGLVFSALDQAKKLRTRESQAKLGWTMGPPRGP